MSLKIISVERVNPAPCAHWLVVVDDDGVKTERVIHANEFEAMRAPDFPGVRGDMAMQFVLDQHRKGAELKDLVDVEIESPKADPKDEVVKSLGMASFASLPAKKTMTERGKDLLRSMGLM